MFDMADHDDDDEEVPNSQDLQDEDDADVRRQLREAELSPHEQRRSLDGYGRGSGNMAGLTPNASQTPPPLDAAAAAALAAAEAE